MSYHWLFKLFWTRHPASSEYYFLRNCPVVSQFPLHSTSQLIANVFSCSALSNWYMNGNYLIIIVTVCIILPLALMKHLGKSCDPTTKMLRGGVTRRTWIVTVSSVLFIGYLGYTSGFSLTCMLFFLIAVSPWISKILILGKLRSSVSSFVHQGKPLLDLLTHFCL